MSLPNASNSPSIFEMCQQHPDREIHEVVRRLQLGQTCFDEVPESAWEPIPPELKQGLKDYLVQGLETGGFLKSVLANDLRGALCHGHPVSLFALRDLVQIIFTWFPSASHGSSQTVDNWTGVTADECRLVIEAAEIIDIARAEQVAEVLTPEPAVKGFRPQFTSAYFRPGYQKGTP